jgi:hypothetical protein
LTCAPTLANPTDDLLKRERAQYDRRRDKSPRELNAIAKSNLNWGVVISIQKGPFNRRDGSEGHAFRLKLAR